MGLTAAKAGGEKSGGAVGAIGGGLINDYFIRRGVSEGKKGYGKAIGTLEAGKQEGLSYLMPYMDIGKQSISPLSQLLLGKSYDAETGQFSDVAPENRLSAFYQSPDYQFRLDQGQKALEYSQAARGGLLSGRALQESQQLGQNLASSEYGNYLQRLFGLAGMGQSSAGQGANIAGNVASQIGTAQIGIGNLGLQGNIARGQNWADTAGSLGGMFGGGAGGAGGAGAGAGAGGAGAGGSAMSSMIPFFSDSRLKENIKRVGTSQNGIPIYHFDYIDKKLGQFRYEGVIAQDLLESHPEALIKEDDLLKVDYSKIDVNFRRV